MRLQLDVLGHTIVFEIAAQEFDVEPERASLLESSPMGFVPSPGDQRWEKGAGDGYL